VKKFHLVSEREIGFKGCKICSYMMDNQRFIQSKVVTLKGKDYQEFKSADIMNPRTRYAEIVDDDFILADDRDICLALREKYSYDVRTLFGTLILDGGGLMLDEDEFVVDNGELIILDERKRAIFNKTVPSKKKCLLLLWLICIYRKLFAQPKEKMKC